MQHRSHLVFVIPAAVFIAALLTGPGSFDATDGAEFAVAGSRLETAHPPGYPLFLMLLRVESILFSPLYGHLRLINCILGAVTASILRKPLGGSQGSSVSAASASVMLLLSAPVLSQLNSLEIYPLAMALTAAAIRLRSSRLGGYATGMAVFGGHPTALFSVPMLLPSKRKVFFFITALIPLSLMLYLPLRAPVSRIAHYGHPGSLQDFLTYFSMYSGKLQIPSLKRLMTALSFAGPVTGTVYSLTAAAGGRFKAGIDIPALLALVFMASYQLPDPAGQLWILLLPLTFRAASGIRNLISLNKAFKWILPLTAAASALSGIHMADRTEDDIALRWTTDVFSEIPPGAVYRPVAHDVFYAAYASEVLGFRSDVILSDPYGNYFELNIPTPVPCMLGNRPVILSRGWNRMPEFKLSGLVFHPAANRTEPCWNTMSIFKYNGSSPDPMALDLAAEAWARRILQTDNPALADSFFNRAMGFASTELTEKRIEEIRNSQ
ncbi:hypothetical protein CSA37_13265 [Candidatus Fermentibacteria bacterium]|nr:MAG: hypothetical protein CSA37_13265 [Candidatus Fermentibacteria bacterium]